MAITIRSGNFTELSEFVLTIREHVFVIEQKVPLEIERDERDPVCQHVLLHDGQTLIGTGRIDISHHGKLGRIAVLPTHRRHGFGRMIVNALEEIAARHHLAEVCLHAQVDVIEFYEKLGYKLVGDVFKEAGIMHRKMVKHL